MARNTQFYQTDRDDTAGNKQPKTDWPELSAELRAAEEQVMVLCEERRRPSIDWAAIAEELKAGEEICAARAVENATGRR